MTIRSWWLVACCGVFIGVSVSAQQSSGRPGYNEAFIGAPLADPVMQYNKESYVTYGCAYCHGVNLVPRGEAVDLRRSALVASDVDGSVIVRALRAGFWQTTRLSPMPQYADLSDQQLNAIASYIHYAKQRDRYATLAQGPVPAGSAASGQADFAQRCQSCHAGASLNGIGRRYDAPALRAHLLEPPTLTAGSFALDRLQDTRLAEGRLRHQRLLETYSSEEVANLVAYLRTLN